MTRKGCLVLLVFALYGSAVAGPATKGSWFQVETEHFTLYSNVDKERSASMAVQLERLRTVLATISPELDLVAPRPSYIYVFRDNPSFRSYARGKTTAHKVGGLFFSRREGDYVMVDASSELDPFGVIYHEYLHQVMTDNFPRAPLWINEGIAEYFSSFWSNGFYAEVGLPIEDYVRYLRTGRMMPFDSLLAVDSQSWTYQTPEWKKSFHAQSWAMVHFLIHGGESDPLGEYARAMKAGEPPQAALESLIEASAPELATTIKDYLARDELPHSTIELERRLDAPDLDVNRLTEEDVLCALGRLMFLGDDKSAVRAEKHFTRALKINPDHAASHAALGELRSVQGRFDEADALFRKSIELDGDDHWVHYLRGRNAIHKLQVRAKGAIERSPEILEDVLEARESFERSTELSPGFAESWVGLGYTFLFEQPVPDLGVDALERARSELPSRGDVVYYQVLALLQRGERAQAYTLLDESFGSNGRDEWLTRAEQAIVAENVKAAQTMAQRGEPAAGVVLLRRAAQAVRDPGLRIELQMQIQKLDGQPSK